MSDETLKPCPFCGGEAHTYKNNLWHVGCEHAHNNCVTMSAFVTEAEAIAAWNARAERTCRNKARYGNFKCDVCNAFLQLTDFDEEPMLTVNGVGHTPNYCPNCGAKVVGK